MAFLAENRREKFNEQLVLCRLVLDRMRMRFDCRRRRYCCVNTTITTTTVTTVTTTTITTTIIITITITTITIIVIINIWNFFRYTHIITFTFNRNF